MVAINTKMKSLCFLSSNFQSRKTPVKILVRDFFTAGFYFIHNSIEHVLRYTLLACKVVLCAPGGRNHPGNIPRSLTGHQILFSDGIFLFLKIKRKK